MKTAYHYLSLLITLLLISSSALAKSEDQAKHNDILVIQGEVVDAETNEALVFATIGLQNTNIATVSNSEGDFTLKVPAEAIDDVLTISYIGHANQELAIRDIKNNKRLKIKLKPVVVHLIELSVFPDNPLIIINNVLDNVKKNYSTEGQLMTAFYRETIKKGRQYTALAEAVVEVYKMPYTNSKEDQVKIRKGRKGRDVSKMDTLLFKLQGGVHSTLAMDIIKHPYSIIAPEVQDAYNYTFENITLIDGETHLVIAFKQKANVYDPMFYGKLYIHAETMAISSATFSLNTTEKKSASAIFIRKKPFNCDITPNYAHYIVNYRRQGDKWYYSYSRGDLEFEVDWKKRLFNTTYSISSESAITDRKPIDVKSFERADRLKKSAIMNETVSGFYDEDFWGDYNVIDPERSINTAIKKIAKRMDKLD